MLLRQVHCYTPREEMYGDIRIDNGRIVEIGKGLAPRKKEAVFDLQHYLVLPGLINAHEHLEWNLLALHCKPPYTNFSDYVEDVHKPEDSPVRELLNIDFRDRLLWGGFKNLISGVTTVCHHNPYDRFFEKDFPIRVMKNFAWSHSLKFSQNITEDYAASLEQPFIVHAAEGTDHRAQQEIADLDNLGLLKKNTVIVHGVALHKQEIDMLASRGSSLIWCPASNLNLFAQTAPINELRGHVPVALGTDSLLTGSSTLFEEMQLAFQTDMVTPEELLSMVTTDAVKILHLPEKTVSLAVTAPADMIVLPDLCKNPGDTLLHSAPKDLKLVIIAGKIHLADTLNGIDPNIQLQGRPKFITGNLVKLKKRIARYFDGRDEFLESPLWKMVQPL